MFISKLRRALLGEIYIQTVELFLSNLTLYAAKLTAAGCSLIFNGQTLD